MRTPQEIKDQEFQVKFRGFDSIEVRSYLDELADDFFAMREQMLAAEAEKDNLLQQNNDLTAQIDTLVEEKKSLENKLAEGDESVAEIEKKVEKGYRYKDELIAEITAEKNSLLEEKEAFDTTVAEKDAAYTELEKSLKEKENLVGESETEVVALKSKIDLLEEQIAELKQEGVDFKSTILVAQQFADELKEKAKKEAEEQMAEAQLELELFQEESLVQQKRLEDDLARLGRMHDEVREDLSAKLHLVLDSLTIMNSPVDSIQDVSADSDEESVEDVVDGAFADYGDDEAEKDNKVSSVE